MKSGDGAGKGLGACEEALQRLLVGNPFVSEHVGLDLSKLTASIVSHEAGFDRGYLKKSRRVHLPILAKIEACRAEANKGSGTLSVKSIKRLEDKIGLLEKELAMFRNQLGNPKFVEKAPARLVEELRGKLNELIKSYGRVIDIGLCQANLFWHGHRVNKPEDLLDPQTNLRVANQVLLESIASARGDLELGIGRYHHWTDPTRARNYGSRVLAIYRNLRTM